MKQVKLTTSLGIIMLELDDVKAPNTVANFIQYVNEGFYNGTLFHRVISKFMIQAGGFVTGMVQKAPRSAIQNEADNGLVNAKYTIAMARTAQPHSATSQFFINTTNNAFLNHVNKTNGWGYAVFGHVISGTDVVDAIEKVSTKSTGYHSDVPQTEVVITKAEVITS